MGCQCVVFQCCPPERTLASFSFSVMATAFSLTHSLHKSHPEQTSRDTPIYDQIHEKWASALDSWHPSKGYWVRSTGELWMFGTHRMFSWLWLQEHCATIIMAASELYTKVNILSISSCEHLMRMSMQCWSVNAMSVGTCVWKSDYCWFLCIAEGHRAYVGFIAFLLFEWSNTSRMPYVDVQPIV